ncbi:MAG TPA: hypothetical protein VKM55_27215 [Candidatus Lokiarchaeia archaeon]|nr:hypothetical protein [Candidatus Lokiarchaeia archaeon]
MLQIEDMLANIAPSLLMGLVIIIISSIALQIYVKEKTKLMLFFFLAWTFFGIFIILNGVSTAINSLLLYEISYFVYPASVILWFAFIDYAMHESVGIKKNIIAFIVCTALIVFILLEPWIWVSSTLTFTTGSPFLDLLFLQISNVAFSLILLSYAYWAIVTFRKAPPILKKSANTLLVLGILAIIAAIIQYTGIYLMLILQVVLSIIVILITIIIIRKDPRIAHVLPYVVYRLLITSKNGPKYYSKSWAQVDLDDDMLSGLMSAIRTAIKGMIAKAIEAGSISEVKMTKGVMLTEMRYEAVNIVLLASKASTALKTALDEFGQEFTKQFYSHLYDKDGFAIEVNDVASVFTSEIMERMIAKYFGSVPSFIYEAPEKALDEFLSKSVEDGSTS